MFCKKVVQEFISWVLKNYKLHPRMRSVTMTVFFFYIDHDTSFHKKRKTRVLILFLAKENLNNHFSLKRFYKACTKLTPLILGLFSTTFQICMKNIKISTHVYHDVTELFIRCPRIYFCFHSLVFMIELYAYHFVMVSHGRW